MELHALSTGRKPRVVTAMTMLKQMLFKHSGHIGAALVLGGVDSTGKHLFTVAPHGSTDKLPYVTMGSGSLAAMAVFESQWKPDLDVCAVIISLEPNDLNVYISARNGNQVGSGCHLSRYLQRSRFRF